jgi:hypothetical protein
MQFAKVQGSALAVLGLLLLALQGYLYVSGLRPAERPTATPSLNVPLERKTVYVPGVIGLLALGLGVYLVVAPGRRARNDETQPTKTSSGLPM